MSKFNQEKSLRITGYGNTFNQFVLRQTYLRTICFYQLLNEACH